MHPPNTTCNYFINPAANSSIPFPPDADYDICSVFTNTYDHSNNLINFPINSSPHSYHYEFDNIYLQFLDHFYQHQFNYYPNPSPDNHSHEIIPTPPPNMLLENYSNSDNICSSNIKNKDEEINAAAWGKKRTCKKDRHSKIHTANGPRDRRMRLSLDIARKFFRLQDLLGFDKASRTVDWLLTKSGDAIRDLAKAGANSGSCSTSVDREDEETPKMAMEKKAAKKKGSRRGKSTAAAAERATVGRESRRKARERARERTSQKRRLMSESNRTEQRKLAFAESSGKESGNDEGSWNPSAALCGYLQCSSGNAGWI